MLERLVEPTKENENPRADLDAQLGVASWSTSFTPHVAKTTVESGAPTWWHGDEEASQSFFRAMNIDPTRLGG